MNQLTAPQRLNSVLGDTLTAMRDAGDLPLGVHGVATRLNLPGLAARAQTPVAVVVYLLVVSGLAIAVVSALAVVTHLPFVFPSLGPTVFLLFYAATSAHASPRNVFCGHLIGVLAGYVALILFGLTARLPDLDDITWQRLGAVTFALCATLTIMVALGVAHAPAAATTLIVALGLLRTPFHLTVLMLAVTLLIVVAFAINRFAGLEYPAWSARLKD